MSSAGGRNRIYRTLEEMVSPEHTALIAWDVQRALVGMAFNRDEFLANMNRLIEAARGAGVPVIYTMIDPLPPRFASPVQAALGRSWGNVDRSMFELALQPRGDEVVVRKNTASAFVGTNVELMLRNAGIDTVVIGGISTEYGVESTARDGVNRGFYMVVAGDASSSSDRAAHERSLENMRRLGLIVVARTDEIVRAWRR
ncbi:cysteine hydrolase family protein [Conexivisphaera calida]|uniref:Isochorismatase n=1 Tax=Conexivisphaera calida TaxID=1874277 RepID=A0A4P2VDV8_9ARCH|nr:isochorismatase family cysteine hydrolase [Conexivisphaera calida]BBE42022.1 Isochorismatase [Conexivisphaera calida]